MSKIFSKYFVTFLLFLFFAAPTLAADYGYDGTATAAGYADRREIPALVNTAVTGIFSLLLIVFFGVMLYAGVRWMSAAGNDEKVEQAKHALEAGAIGIIIVVSAYAITNFVLSKLPAGGGSAEPTRQLTVPPPTPSDAPPPGGRESAPAPI